MEAILLSCYYYYIAFALTGMHRVLQKDPMQPIFYPYLGDPKPYSLEP